MYPLLKYSLLLVLGAIGTFAINFEATAVADDFAEANSAYRNASLALQQGDCKAAIKHLFEYKRLAGPTLKKYPDFARKVDDQILICKKQLESSAAKQKINIYGF